MPQYVIILIGAPQKLNEGDPWNVHWWTWGQHNKWC